MFGCSARRRYRNDPQVIREKDKKALMVGSLTFKLKLLTQRTFPMSQDVAQMREEMVKIMTDLRSWLKCSFIVHVLVKPNLAYIADDKTSGVMHIHLMSTITDIFMSHEDPRFFMYCANDFENGKATCFYFYTPKRQKNVTGERLFNSFLYAHHCWLQREQAIHLRMLRRRVKSTTDKLRLPCKAKETDDTAIDAGLNEVFALSELPFCSQIKWCSAYFNEQGYAAACYVKF